MTSSSLSSALADGSLPMPALIDHPMSDLSTPPLRRVDIVAALVDEEGEGVYYNNMIER